MRAALVLVLAVGCGDSHKAKPPDAPIDTEVPFDVDHDAPIDANPLDDLLGTGLCADTACATINTQDIYAYTPRYTLWADAASKRRWIYLPPGTQIDTTDPDHWLFPQGTKVWKEFTTDTGTRIETRFIWKMGAGTAVTDWYYVAYQWNAANDDATRVPAGVTNANGTTHDIPSQNQCKACHENFQPTRLLGVGAISLDAAAASGEIALDDLIAAGKLTANPAGAASPHYPMPSDATNAYATDAIGYMHANCGHCHNPNSNVYLFNGVTMQLRLTVGNLGAITTTEPYTTAVDQNATINCCTPDTKIIVKTDPASSVMMDRYESNNPAIWMPQLGHKTVDPTGDTLLTNWITHL